MNSDGIHAGVLATTVFAPQRELWGPAIREGSLNLLYAPRGIGKTFFSLKLLHAICTGSPFLRWKGAGGTPGILFDGEMGLRSLARRISMVDETSPIPMSVHDIKIRSYSHCEGGQLWNLAEPEFQKKYEAELQAYPVAVIDNLLTATFARGTFDKDVEQWQRIQPFLVRMRDQGKTIILVHHANKMGLQDGTRQRENIMDCIMALRPVVSSAHGVMTFDLVFDKHRDFWGDDIAPLRVRYENNAWHYERTHDAQKSEIARLRKEKFTAKQIAEALKTDVMEILRALEEEPVPSFHERDDDEF